MDPAPSAPQPRSLRPVIAWLLTGCVLIAAMVVIGGITRLTQSGLSIVEWKLITGTLPPLSEDQWQAEFEAYQQTPQFKLLNSTFSLDDFKGIYWWEYIHRLLGRLIGLVFFIPFLVFLIQGRLKGKLLRRCLILLGLGGLQGLIGWIMVASGLVDMPSVSHYRLALHLITAFFTFAFTLWVALDLIWPQAQPDSAERATAQRRMKTLFWLGLLQIVYGAFVAGLKAGTVASTFPTMNGDWIPAGLGDGMDALGMRSLTEFPITVHFIHRLLAFTLLGFAIYYFNKARSMKEAALRQPFSWLFTALSIQFLLGVITVMTSVSIPMAALHQAGALMVWTCLWMAMHRLRKGV